MTGQNLDVETGPQNRYMTGLDRLSARAKLFRATCSRRTRWKAKQIPNLSTRTEQSLTAS